MSETDEALVLKAQKQDGPAFEELVRRTARLLYSQLYLETRDPHRTEDLVQETFLQAWRSIHQVTDPHGFRTWLLAIAQSVRLDGARRESRKKRTAPVRALATDAAEAVASGTASPMEKMERDEAQDRAVEALRSLPDEYRLPLTLRYLAGADYATISRQLGLSNGSLRGLLNRGMSRLREQLARPMKSPADP